MCLAVSTEYRRVTDGQTDGQTDIFPRHSLRYTHRLTRHAANFTMYATSFPPLIESRHRRKSCRCYILVWEGHCQGSGLGTSVPSGVQGRSREKMLSFRLKSLPFERKYSLKYMQQTSTWCYITWRLGGTCLCAVALDLPGRKHPKRHPGGAPSASDFGAFSYKCMK